MAKFHG